MDIKIRQANKNDIPILIKLHIKLLDFEGVREINEENIKLGIPKIINSEDSYIF